MSLSVWRTARAEDDDSIAEMFLDLYDEDPGPSPVSPGNIRFTLAALRHDPGRGRAVVLDIDGKVSGYALLIAFWSNELGGEICEVDELFVVPQLRNQGHGSALFRAIARRDLWPCAVVAIALGVTRNNAMARRLYERLGFAEVGAAMILRIEQGVTLTIAPEDPSAGKLQPSS